MRKILFLYWIGWIILGMGIIRFFAPLELAYIGIYPIIAETSYVIPGFLMDLLGLGNGVVDLLLDYDHGEGKRFIYPLFMFTVGCLLIYLSKKSLNKTPRHCLDCNKVYDVQKKFCPKCGVELKEVKLKYITLFKYALVLIVTVRSLFLFVEFENLLWPSGDLVIPNPGYGSRLFYTTIVGLIVFIFIIVIPNLFSRFLKKNEEVAL